MTSGDAGDPGREQPVTVRYVTVSSHLARIERACGKSKLAILASRLLAQGGTGNPDARLAGVCG
jgi:hypothetical protein